MSRFLKAALAGLSLVAIAASPAAAQSQPAQGGFQGLFGSTGKREPRRTFDLMLSVFEQYDTAVTDGLLPQGDDPSLAGGRPFSGARGAFELERRGARSSFGLRGEGSARYYPSRREVTHLRYRTEFGLGATLGRRGRTTIVASGSAEHQPYYQLPFLGDVPALQDAVSVPREDPLLGGAVRVYTGAFALTHAFSARTSLVLDQHARLTDFSTGRGDLRDGRAGIRLEQRFTRYLGLRLGYGYRIGQSSIYLGGRIDGHDLDVGLDYRRPLTRSRKTTLAFGSGASRLPALSDTGYQVNGFVNLRHEMGRGWAVQVDYRRGLELAAGVPDALFADTVGATLGGYLDAGGRFELTTNAGYTAGRAGVAGTRYEHLQGSGRLRVAVSRYLAVDATYLFYRADLGGLTVMDRTLPELDRQSVFVMATLWLPLFR